VVDLSGFEKDDTYYSQAWFFPNKPLVHIIPQNWNFDPTSLITNRPIYLADCKTSSYFQWKFNPGTAGALIESVGSPGQCIMGAPSDTYPAITASCNASNPLFIFYEDTYGQIYYIDSNKSHICLDIEDESGPSIGYWTCKNAQNTNQDWKITNDGYITSTDPNFVNKCLGFDDGTSIQVWVYTNGDSVELFLNNKSLGKQSVAPYEIGQYTVTYEPGVVVAAVTKNGQSWGNDTTTTTASPNYLNLILERPITGENVWSDGQDTALVYVSLHDSQGHIVRNATNLVTFTVSSGNAKILGTGNGKPSDNTPDQSPSRQLWNGLVRGVIGFGKNSNNGTVTIQATSSGLKSSQITISTQPRPVNYPEI